MLRQTPPHDPSDDFLRFGLVGWPVAQSLSPVIHRKAFRCHVRQNSDGFTINLKHFPDEWDA